MNNKEKPKFLYRGVKIDYELLKKFQFYGVDIKPPHEPIIDENGNKTVGDGNEYGVYMTDNEVVARDAYAAVKTNDGTPINKNIMFGYDKERTMIPSVGIVYKINTDGLDTHIPWITSYLKEHYNNGMGGDEWISESIPASNYSVDTIEIGPDTLHDSEMIQIDDITKIREEVIKKIETRKERLELFEEQIEGIPEKKRFLLDSNKIEILKEIYKIDGIMDIDLQSFEPNNVPDYLKYLMARTYSENKDNIDFTTLEYIQTLKFKLRKVTNPEEMIDFINSEISFNEEKLEEFVSRKQMQNEEYSTASFDRKNDMYNKIKKQLEDKINVKNNDYQENENQPGYSKKENGSIFIEKQEQILKDYSGKELGNRTITWNTDMAKGTEIINTKGTLENEDGKYKMSEESQTLGGELQLQRKELVGINKITGQNEQYVYQKDKNGNEMYYKIANGKLTFKITKNSKGTTIDQYDKGQITDTFEYNENGEALIGMEGIDNLTKNYIENFFDSQIPYFEAENMEIETQKQTVETQKLGKETIDINQDVKKVDVVEKEIDKQMKEQTKSMEEKFEINEFGEIIRPEKSQNDFKESMKVNLNTDEYVDEVLKKFEQDLENGTLEQEEQKKKYSHKVEKGDDDYVM